MPDLDLDALAAVAEAATPGEMYFDGVVARKFRAAFDPPTVLALIAEAREAARLRRDVTRVRDGDCAICDLELMEERAEAAGRALAARDEVIARVKALRERWYADERIWSAWAVGQLDVALAIPEPQVGRHCCAHDSDSHDGAGCLDCPCPLGPPHVGYNPTPPTTDAEEANEA